MGDATNLQTNFLGGEIAPSSQGRADNPKYKIGMNKSFNGLPIEAGSWQRRPGTRVAAMTRAGALARIIDFDFSENAPYTAEFTDGHLRFFSNYSLVHTFDAVNVVSISTANPAVVTTAPSSGFSNGDSVEFNLTGVALTPEQGALLQGRQFLVGGTSGSTFNLSDPITGAGIDGSVIAFVAGTPCMVQRVLDIPTPYSMAMLPDIRGIQASNDGVNTMVLLNGKVAPQALTASEPPNPTFALNAANFLDGPYADPISDGTTITPSAVSGTVTLTASTSKFLTSDIGRHIRLLSQPADWAVATAYATGALVTYQNAYYVALQATTGNIPGADAVNWGVAANASAWVWGIITAYTSATVVTAALQVVNTSTLQLPGVLVNTNAIKVWRFGLFNSVTGYAACGTYHEGRLWLSGVLGNRIDAGVPNDLFNFSPTAVDGTVSDANAIAYVFNAKDINSIFWMTPVQTGILCGTQAGEWLVRASANDDILTPTNIQAKRVTKYGCANVEPCEAPFATLFVSRNNKKMFEYLADIFSGKYSGINVSLNGAHLLTSGVAEIRYQKELSPVVWVRMNDGTIAGMTYRRESPMLSEGPAFAGWHSHALGTGRSVVSIAVGPSMGGNLDSVSMVTFDPSDGLYRIELLADLFAADDGENTDAWFVDGGTVPAGAFLTPTQLTLYGLTNYEGKNISAYVAGIDGGDYTVTNGQAVIPLPAGYNGSKLLTYNAIAAADGASDFAPINMPVAYNIPNFPTNTQSIQSYIGPTTPVTGIYSGYLLVDVKNNRLFAFSSGNASTNGIRVFDITTGVQINVATHDQIFGPNASKFIVDPMCLGHDGYIYMTMGVSNCTGFVKIDPNTLRIVGSIGSLSAATTWPTIPPFQPFPNTPYPGSICAASINGAYFAVSAANLLSFHSISVLEMTPNGIQNAYYFYKLDEDFGKVCEGGVGTGVVYTLAKSTSVATTIPLGLYVTRIAGHAGAFGNPGFSQYLNSHISTTKIGTISPAQIDATWTNISAVSIPVHDNTDNNLIFSVATTDAVTNKAYLVKVGTVTGAVLWKIPVSSLISITNSYVDYGSLDFLVPLAGTMTYYHVNTLAGTATTTTVIGFNTVGTSVYNATLGTVFSFLAFSQTTGSPTLLNSTPAVFTNWARIFMGTAATAATGRRSFSVPAAVGTTFTSIGQRLRPLAPEETGARNGPSLGKTRRNHRVSFLLQNTTGLKFGTNFLTGKLHPMNFKTNGGTTYLGNQLFSGVFSDTIEDDYSYDGMICWQSSRPYPANVLAVEGFLQTQDK